MGLSTNYITASTDSAGNVTGLVGPGVVIGVQPSTAGMLRLIAIGDSFTATNAMARVISSISRTSNVVSVTTSVSHGAGSLQRCRISNCLDASYNNNDAPLTRTGATTFTYPSVGADGSTAGRKGATACMQNLDSCNDNGYLFWLNAKTGGALTVTNVGTNGHNSADMLARYGSDVLAYQNTDVVVILTGYNDFNDSVSAGNLLTADQVYNNVVAMAKQSYGKLVVIVSAIPWTTGQVNTDRLSPLRYNRKIRAWCNSTPNVRFADAAALMIDATNATKFSPLAGMLNSDGIHPSAKGAERIAQAVYTALLQNIPAVSRLISCNGDNYLTDPTNKVISDFAPWANTGGTVAGGATGTAAGGFTVTNAGSGTTVASVPARSDGIGYDQQVVFTPAANNDTATINLTTAITGRYTAGQSVRALAELSLSGLSGANIKSIESYVLYTGSSGIHIIAAATQSASTGYPSADMTLTLASFVDSVVPTGTTSINFYVIFKAAGVGTALTAKLGRFSLEITS